ncbi:PFAM peptidase S8 and S53 [Fragilaria crotonensis]|nr:PFAM peptidase S8 and S53 [Fragilaria crotonensis]
MKFAFAPLLVVALLGLKTVVPVHGQQRQPFDDSRKPVHKAFNKIDATGGFEQDKYIVGYKNQLGLETVRSESGAVRLNLPYVKAVAATMTRSQAEALKLNPNIAYVEYDYKLYPIGLRGGGTNSVPSLPHHRRLAEVKPYGIGMVQADQLSFNTTSPVKVCIIDTGYNFGHEDLPTSGVKGWSDVGAGIWSKDGYGHGTHVAGTIAAIGNNGKGVIGVSPGVKLHIARVFDDDAGWAYSSDLVGALNSCRAAGANIVSMSIGRGGPPSITEANAFDALSKAGMLSVAAAGNDGDYFYSYPASYSSVVSVAAIDSSKTVAYFSQYNDQVDLAAPGVDVRSTVPMGMGLAEASLVVGATGYTVTTILGSEIRTATGPLFVCSLGDCEGASGKVCLIKREDSYLDSKVDECAFWDGIAVIIYNNQAGEFVGELYYYASIPVVSTSDTDGAALLNMAGTSATISFSPSNYDSYSGTSMATPHVSGVAALVWSRYPACTKDNILNALFVTAMDLGTKGRDDFYGHGLVQAKAASDFLSKGCCTARGGPCRVGLNCCSGTCQGGNKPTCK